MINLGFNQLVESNQFSVTSNHVESQINLDFKAANQPRTGFLDVCSFLDSNYIFMLSLLLFVIILRVF